MIEEMYLQIEQFNSKSDADAVKGGLTHRSIHLNSDKKDIDELTHRSVHEL
jgi:hypothetical protein